MLGRYISKKLGREKELPPTEQFYSPLRIALHSTIELTTVDMLILQEQLHPSFVLPQPPLSVMAIGKMTRNNVPIYRVYLEDSSGEQYVLQIVEGKDFRTQEPKVDEVALFQQVVTLEPETEASLDRALSDIGFMDIDLDGIVYDRLWGDQFTEKLPFVRLSETTVEPSGVKQYTNEYVLYGRTFDNPVGDEPVTEFLLVGLEQDEGAAQIMMQVGLKLHTTDVSVL